MMFMSVVSCFVEYELCFMPLMHILTIRMYLLTWFSYHIVVSNTGNAHTLNEISYYYDDHIIYKVLFILN